MALNQRMDVIRCVYAVNSTSRYRPTTRVQPVPPGCLNYENGTARSLVVVLLSETCWVETLLACSLFALLHFASSLSWSFSS